MALIIESFHHRNEYKPLDTVPERRFFAKESSPEHMTHHLNLKPLESGFWKNQLAFRDLLGAHDHIADEGVELKKRLAELKVCTHQLDREGKTEFSARVLELAKTEEKGADSE